jgi:hypothetical protein
MSRLRKKYTNGQKRGGTPGRPTSTTGAVLGRNPKDYHKQAIAFHGGDTAYENWVNGGRKGYGVSKK